MSIINIIVVMIIVFFVFFCIKQRERRGRSTGNHGQPAAPTPPSLCPAGHCELLDDKAHLEKGLEIGASWCVVATLPELEL